MNYVPDQRRNALRLLRPTAALTPSPSPAGRGVNESPILPLGLTLLDERADPFLLVLAVPQLHEQLALEREDESIALSVFNPGAPIPEDVRARLFDSMFQFRRDSIGKPHFGLGLHIVRLIAEFHGGRAFAENPPSGGARVGARFPVLEPRQGHVQAAESSAGFTGPC